MAGLRHSGTFATYSVITYLSKVPTLVTSRQDLIFKRLLIRIRHIGALLTQKFAVKKSCTFWANTEAMTKLWHCTKVENMVFVGQRASLLSHNLLNMKLSS